ncbi:MAG TPA: hypothetical protein PKE57_05425 [Cellvibrionaceae bacterium]|nr:hypothetical protein [Cellvibrionaceae bacterium]HMW47192.1 hypothetical protein [Cellvibrionaceae bacterium]HMW70482.1 hypothetical protein [Cellvibrionaceae bacterium]HNG60549.1 hypothetical protein [Cellvibrionaceae bacterium]
MYIALTGTEDDLHKLETLTLQNAVCIDLKNSFTSNLKLSLEAVSTPFYVGLLASGLSQSKLIENFAKQGAAGCLQSYETAKTLLDNKSYLTGIQSIIPTFQAMHEYGLANNQFQALYKLVAMRFYGALEDLSKQALKIIITKNICNLDILSAQGLKIAKSDCVKLKRRIIQQQQEHSLTIEHAYDEEISHLSYQVFQYTELFSALMNFSIPDNIIDLLTRLESSRHLFTHRNSIVDQKYINEVGNNLEIGDTLHASPDDMYRWQNAIIDYSAALLESLDTAYS